MKKKIIVASICLVSAHFCVAITIKMPNKQILQERLDKIGMTFFAEKTGIIDELANKEKAPLGVNTTLTLCMNNYFEYVTKNMPKKIADIQKRQMYISRPMILEALLENQPEALQELENLGFYQPSPSKL